MIFAKIDMPEIQEQLTRLASDFGECNETGIARWGVATCRRLTTTSQVWGDDSKALQKQKEAIRTGALAVVTVVPKLSDAKAGSAFLAGDRKRKVLKTPSEVNDHIDKLRRGKKRHTPRIDRKYKAVTSQRVFDSAMSGRNRHAFRAKGGWIGAGLGIARFQKTGSRLTIGKNFATAAHKWKAGGRAAMKRAIWTPEGTIENMVSYVSSDYVLSKADAAKAVMDAGRNTIAWYEKTMQARLNKRSK